MRYLVHVMLLVWVAATHAETLTGRVIGISDGDTITVLVEHQQIKVKLNAIDAPESRQPYGKRAMQSLSAIACQKDARLNCPLAGWNFPSPSASWKPRPSCRYRASPCRHWTSTPHYIGPHAGKPRYWDIDNVSCALRRACFPFRNGCDRFEREPGSDDE